MKLTTFIHEQSGEQGKQWFLTLGDCLYETKKGKQFVHEEREGNQKKTVLYEVVKVEPDVVTSISVERNIIVEKVVKVKKKTI